ncbi:MAG: serine/threonine protein kinase [Phycisphaerae bacterium]|nr:serine/threonine protein kinase [Phycisphaerae bacterium]
MNNGLPKFKEGEEVEGYRVMAELGVGAASVVYLVTDPKTKHVWALKHVHRGDAKDTRFLDQAIYEYEVASKLDHPNIRKIPRLIKKKERLIRLMDVFLVMEMLDGRSMDIKPPKTFEDAVTIFHQTASAMAHMHARGFIHADMKPNNILVQTGPVAKIIDLGQSCPVGTVKPRIQGTPDYIAPEQVHRRPITEKTDVYNLGATMYWTVTNRNIPTALPKDRSSLVSRIDDALMEKPTPPIEINPRIHSKLNELIMHCVEVDPARRPASMQQVVDRLELILGLMRVKPSGAGDGGVK